jgi:hypothetical protein
VEDGGVQSIVIKTSNRSEKKNNTLALTVLEIDMLSIMLSEKYTNNFTKLSNQTIYNGRRKVLMEVLPEREQRMRFTLMKYMTKNSTWFVRNSVVLTIPKVKTLMKIYDTKIRAKLASYEGIRDTPMIDEDDDEAEVDGDSDDEAYTVKPPKSRRLEPAAEPAAMDSTESPTNTTGSEEH